MAGLSRPVGMGSKAVLARHGVMADSRARARVRSKDKARRHGIALPRHDGVRMRILALSV